MVEVKKIFLEIVSELNKENIEPTVYGSLGLYFKMGKDKSLVEDVDFIVNDFEEFLRCKKVMEKIGFQIDPNHEREMARDDVYVSFINRSDVEKLIAEPLKLEKAGIEDMRFFNINMNQYRKIYEEGLKNEHRKARKEKDDLEKIKEIDNFFEPLNS